MWKSLPFSHREKVPEGRVRGAALGRTLLGFGITARPSPAHRFARPPSPDGRGEQGGPMDFDLSKPQKLLKDTARQFLSRECKPERVRALMATGTAFDAKLWQAMADQGWMGLVVPEAEG